MDEITINNFVALLEECVDNGDEGPETLWAWFLAERGLIERTIKDVTN